MVVNMKICKRMLYLQLVNHLGDVQTCGWIRNNYKLVGNINENTIEEIYAKDNIKKIRDKIAQDDFSMCERDYCPFLAMDNIEEFEVDIEEIPNLPEELSLSFEISCNYRCKSCNAGKKIERLKGIELEKNYKAIEAELERVLPYVKRLSANGLGEIFSSPHTLNLLANWKPLCNPEEVEVLIETNGSLFDEEHWKKIQNLGQYKLSVAITVMSFDEKAYQFLSGVNYPISKIISNLKYVKELKEKGVINHLEIATVVQERNFRYLVDFTSRALEEFGADTVRLRPFSPWGAQDENIEWFSTINNPLHPYYCEYKEIMTNPIFNDPRVKDWSGGKDAELVTVSPLTKTVEAKQLLAKVALDEGDIIDKIRKTFDDGNFVLYACSDVAKVLVNNMLSQGIKPKAIIDVYNKGVYKGIEIISIDDAGTKYNDAGILITISHMIKQINEDLDFVNMRGKRILLKDIV